jgi:hypothetical protein
LTSDPVRPVPAAVVLRHQGRKQIGELV